jgi:hypothetical protein
MNVNAIIRAAFAALVLTTAATSMAHAASWGRPDSTVRQGPYDNTANNKGGNYTGGDGA